MIKYIILFFILIFSTFSQSIHAQFIDEFSEDQINGWFFFTGDGKAEMNFEQKEDFARITVDATNDKDNVWWAIIKRDVSEFMDLSKLNDPAYELRVEARVRLSDSPRRINFMLNTNRTTNFHEHLKEYYIDDTTGWHTISMTTRNFDAHPGDTVYVQLGVTDWGLGEYYVDVDYYKADVLLLADADEDLGEPLTYHPELPDLNSFSNKQKVSNDCSINTLYPDINFNDWKILIGGDSYSVIGIDEDQWGILRWDFVGENKLVAESAAILELTTCSVSKGGNYESVYGEDFGMEFGKVRIVEIIGGNPSWDEATVTYNSLIEDQPIDDVINGQMIFDTEVDTKSGKNYITIPRPVIQRLIEGKTKGLAIKPLGSINVSFYSSKSDNEDVIPKLYFNLDQN